LLTRIFLDQQQQLHSEIKRGVKTSDRSYRMQI